MDSVCKRMPVAGIIIMALAACLFQGCGKTTSTRRVSPAKPSAPAVAEAVPAESHFASGKSYDALEKADAAVKPAVKGYSVKAGLANVANLKTFKKVLLPEQIRMIAKNAFVVTPTSYTQMFHVYENNEYQQDTYPSFITTDSMLHTYHIFYDYSLRTVESTKLFGAAVKLSEAMLAASEKDLRAAKSPLVKDAARRNVAYFAVARNLLKGTAVPVSVKDMATPELQRIAAHTGRAVSDILGVRIDFSQFVPRGHYTRSEKLKKYFRALMWYGLSPFPLPKKPWGETPTVQSLLMVRNLRTVQAGRESAMKLWDMIYEPTAFYVGKADDYTIYNYSTIADRIYGKDPEIERFAEKPALDRFAAEVKRLPGPRIENFVAVSRADSRPDPFSAVGRQFRFMGQRFIPDSRIMQELTHPKANGRNFPKGLDVCAAIGSDRALSILQNTYGVYDFVGYKAQMRKMRKEMADTPRATWQSNLYYGWLWSLQSLIKPAPEGYPSFMRGSAWQDKSLYSALGSWTELRHDTILYAKQSVSECGGGEEEKPKPKGYVEPNLEFWTKLKWLNQYTADGLASRSLLTEELKDKFKKLGDWLDFCRKITIKELTNRKITDEEYAQIELYGADLEQMTLSFSGGDILSDTDKDMALVADVHTSFGNVMEEGTGRAAEIYVVVPIEGKLYLTRGAVYTQYEFMHPASDRLTDEKWQRMLKSGQEPGFAEWTKSFLTTKRKKAPPQFENYAGGC